MFIGYEGETLVSNEILILTMPLDPALALTTNSFSFSAALRCTT